MATTSEGRKRLEDEARLVHARKIVRQHQRTREVVQQALEAIMSGASFDDADCFVDALADLGARVEVEA